MDIPTSSLQVARLGDRLVSLSGQGAVGQLGAGSAKGAPARLGSGWQGVVTVSLFQRLRQRSQPANPTHHKSTCLHES